MHLDALITHFWQPVTHFLHSYLVILVALFVNVLLATTLTHPSGQYYIQFPAYKNPLEHYRHY